MRAAYEAVAGAHRRSFDALWAAGREPRRDMGKSYKLPLFEAEGGHPAFYPLLDPPLLMAVSHGAQDRAGPNFIRLTSLGLDIGIFCDFLYSVLLH
jgi:hypothetical protein